MNKNALFSTGNDDWSTPKEIYDAYISWGYFDPCPYKCLEDNLDKPWGERNFINPPYSKMNEWVDAVLKHKGEHILLVAARTDTKWFHRLLPYTESITFIKGRLHFNGSKMGAPFPSIIMRVKI